MKAITVRFMLTLGCSCRPNQDSVGSTVSHTTIERQEAVHGVINRYFSSSTGSETRADGSEIRGPLSVIEVEEDLDELGKERSDEKNKIVVGGSAWDRMKGDLKAGDELYFFRSGRQSWAELCGWEGYVQVRGETVVHHFPVRMN